MEKYIEVTGKNEDAAIEKGLAQLGLSRDDVSVEVLERAKTGFLGIGSSPAKVKLTYQVPDEPVVEEKAEKPAPAVEPAAPAQAEPAEETFAPAEQAQAKEKPASGEKAEQIERFLNDTNVDLCFDTGHFTFSKEDAVKAAKEFGPRIGHVHLKDIRPDMMEKAYAEGFKFRKAVLEGCFTIPGDGCVDYPGVFKALHDAHYEGWFIVEAEQDPAKANPLEYAKMAREYIRKTTGI